MGKTQLAFYLNNAVNLLNVNFLSIFYANFAIA